MKKINIAIILVNWNGIADTLRAIESLKKLKTEYEYKIYVVDNGSTDKSVEILKQDPSIEIISLKDNVGFTGGNNAGMQRALANNADYFWLLNNDTTIDPHALDPLVKPFSVRSVGITVSKIYFMKGQEFHFNRYQDKDRGNIIWYAGGIIDWNNVYGSHRGVDEVDTGQYDTVEPTTYATGCSMMISRDFIEHVGLFDERYFAYLEDMDLSMRAVDKGFTILYVPQSKVWHKNAGSTARPGNNLHQYYMTRNRILFSMTYASTRTKFAVIRESFRLAMYGSDIQKKAIIDAALQHWGKQYYWEK